MFNEIENESHQDSPSMVIKKTPVAFKGTPNILEQDIQPRYHFVIENESIAKDCVIDDKINNRKHNGKRKPLPENPKLDQSEIKLVDYVECFSQQQKSLFMRELVNKTTYSERIMAAHALQRSGFIELSLKEEDALKIIFTEVELGYLLTNLKELYIKIPVQRNTSSQIC